jgi:hypothetical protein
VIFISEYEPTFLFSIYVLLCLFPVYFIASYSYKNFIGALRKLWHDSVAKLIGRHCPRGFAPRILQLVFRRIHLLVPDLQGGGGGVLLCSFRTAMIGYFKINRIFLKLFSASKMGRIFAFHLYSSRSSRRMPGHCLIIRYNCSSESHSLWPDWHHKCGSRQLNRLSGCCCLPADMLRAFEKS